MFHVKRLSHFFYLLPSHAYLCFKLNLSGMAFLLWAAACWFPAFAADQLCLQTKTTGDVTSVVLALRQPSTNAGRLGVQLIYRGAAFLT